MDDKGDRQERTAYKRIARQQNITPQWAREMYKRYKGKEHTIHFDKPGRKKTPINIRIAYTIRTACAVEMLRWKMVLQTRFGGKEDLLCYV